MGPTPESHTPPAGELAPGHPVAKRMGSIGEILGGVFWLMRWPSRAAGKHASLTVPFARVARPLLVTQIAILVIGHIVVVTVARRLFGSFDQEYLLRYFVTNVAGFVLASVAIEILGSFALASVLLTWWRVPPKTQRPWDLTAILFSGVVIAMSAYLPLLLVAAALFAEPVYIGSWRYWAHEAISQSLGVGAYVIIGYWAFRFARTLTPAADLRGTAWLIAAVVAGRWACTLKLTRYLWIVYVELMNSIYWMLPI